MMAMMTMMMMIIFDGDDDDDDVAVDGARTVGGHQPERDEPDQQNEKTSALEPWCGTDCC